MKKCSFDKLVVGERLSEVQYYEVEKKGSDSITVRNERGFSFNVSKAIVEEGMHSSLQVEEEIECVRTEMSRVLREHAGETVFTVCFKKKPDVKALKEAFNDPNTLVKTQKQMTEMLEGEERVMTGYLINVNHDGTGRLLVRELDGDYVSKQVDPRTLQWLILRGKKYVLK